MKLLVCAAAIALCAMPLTLGAQETTTRNVQMSPATALLTKSLDAKKSKSGDPVMAKLDKEVKLDGGPTLPSGTVLMGKVDQVTPSMNKGESTIQVTFDEAQTKAGQKIPVKATVMQIAAPVSVMSFDQQGGNPNSPGPMPSAVSPSAAGGAPGNRPGAAPAPQASPGPSGENQMPSQVEDKSGYHGVTLRSDIHDKDSGTFVDSKKNVHLSSGTRLNLAIASVPPNTIMQ